MPSVTAADGPVVVTGASGFIGAHTIIALLKRGYDVRGCVTDLGNKDKTDFLSSLNDSHPGTVTLHQANLLEDGSYDAVIDGCSAVLHVGTPMGYGGVNKPQQVYDGMIGGINNIVGSVRNAGTVKRLVYTSSFAAIGHPAPPGYRYTESDWASDNREDDEKWNTENLNEKGEVGYAYGKVEGEHLVTDSPRKTVASRPSRAARSLCWGRSCRQCTSALGPGSGRWGRPLRVNTTQGAGRHSGTSSTRAM